MKSASSARFALLVPLLPLLISATSYEWPLRLPPALTSTYGEYRAGHFHGGFDLSTGGRAGATVVAVDDGHVERVRASGSGYGKAIYLRLADGRTAVYAHLSEFSPRIRAYVEAAQDSLARYEVDLYPPPDLLSVRRGEVIAASGASGAGPAHFHFEIRRGDEGLNPLVHGFAVADPLAPSILQIDLVPLDGDSRAAGSPGRVVAWPDAVRSGQRGAPVSVRGRLGVSVRAHDRSPGRPNKLAVFEAEAFVNGRLFSACRFDSVSWLRAHEVDAAYDLARVLDGRNDFVRLWRLPGTTARIYGGDGILDCDALEPGEHTVEIVVRDAAGNAARRSFRIETARRLRFVTAGAQREAWGRLFVIAAVDTEHGAPAVRALAHGRTLGPLIAVGEGIYGGAFDDLGAPSILLEASAGNGFRPTAIPIPIRGRELIADSTASLALRIEFVPHARMIEARVISPEPLAAPPSMRLSGGWGTLVLEPEAIGEVVYRAVFTPSERQASGASVEAMAEAVSGRRGRAEERLPVTFVASGRAGRIDFDETSLVVAYEPASFFGDALMTVKRIDPPPPAQDLVPVSPSYRLGPREAALDAGIVLGMPVPAAGAARAALYRRDGARWSYAGATPDTAAGLVTARVRRLGDYALLRDDTAPILYNVRPAPGSRVGTRPAIAARVGDAGSGVTAATLGIELDGRAAIAEYDPEARSLTAHLRAPLAPGPHEARFLARDRAGNRAVETVRFTVTGATEGKRKR